MEENERYIIKDDLTYGRGYVYSLQYHIVWCTKYCRCVLKDGIDEELKRYLHEIADEYHFSIIAMEVMPDHIHMIKILKGNTARWLFMRHPELKKQLWGGHLWNPSYCIVTVSDRSFDMVKKCINSQKSK